MATGTAKPSLSTSPNAVDNTEKSQIVSGTVAISAAADTYASGGLVLDFTALGDLIKSSFPPTRVRIWSQPPVGSPNTFFYLYSFNPGSTWANGKMQIWTSQGAAAEYTNTAALTNPFADVILFEAVFPRL